MTRRRFILGLVIAVGVAALLALIAYRMYQPGPFAERRHRAGFRWAFLMRASTWSFFGRGLLLTLRLAVVSIALSFVFGVGLALARLASHPRMGMPIRPIAARLVRAPVALVVEVIRSAPLFMLIIFMFFGMPHLGINLSPIMAATVALTLYTSCVLSEIVRAGILSLDRGQFEAAESLGLTYRQRLTQVVLPQALRRMIPAILSQLVTLLKDTSLASVITVTELARRGQILYQIDSNPIEILLVVMLIYFTLNYALSRIARRFEARPVRAAVAKPLVVRGEEDQVVVPAR
jgi:His/Glu/Gln/Arg/opine family amino acid ABC transporter permease subunit